MKQKKTNGLCLIEKDKSEEPKSTEPAGQGETFTPGEWNPTVSKR